jgi:hypothetical protein
MRLCAFEPSQKIIVKGIVMNATKTKVALITPPVLEKVAHHPLFPPLGLAYMAAVLEKNEFEVKIIDSPVLNFDHQKIKRELEAYQPTMVGVGSMTPTIESALKCVQIAKEAAPDAQVLMGGPHATFADTEILSSQTNTSQRHQRNKLPQRQPNNQNSHKTIHPKPRRFTTSSIQVPSNEKI